MVLLRAVSLVFLFLLRIRFPTQESLFTTLRRRYGAQITKDIRAWEKTAKQVVKAELDKTLLLRCHEEGVLPKFLKFRLYRQNLRHTPVFKECQQMLLRNEIDYKSIVKKRLECQCNTYVTNIKESIGWFDFTHVKSFIEKGVELYKDKVLDIHRRKYSSWGGSWSPTNISPQNCIFNFSNYVLSNRESFLLSLGLNFCLPCFKYPKKELLFHFEHMISRLQNQPMAGNGTINEVIDRCKGILRKLPGYFKYTYNMISSKDIDILKRLKKNENIVVCKPDKGNGTVILNRQDYTDKMNGILNDRTKFRKVIHEEIYNSNLNMEDKINHQLRKMKKDGSLLSLILYKVNFL